MNVICNMSINIDHWSYIDIFYKISFQFLKLFYQFINIIGRFLLALKTFYIFFLRSYLKSSREDPMPKAGGCSGWRITSQWWKNAWSFMLLSTELYRRGQGETISLLIWRKSAFCLPPVSYSRNLTACYGN